jgi:hypothetical protein
LCSAWRWTRCAEQLQVELVLTQDCLSTNISVATCLDYRLRDRRVRSEQAPTYITRDGPRKLLDLAILMFLRRISMRNSSSHVPNSQLQSIPVCLLFAVLPEVLAGEKASILRSLWPVGGNLLSSIELTLVAT